MFMKLWRDNKIDEEWELPNEEIARRFWESSWGKRANDSGRPLEYLIRRFVTGDAFNGGLDSAFEEQDYRELHEAIRVAWPPDVKLALGQPGEQP